MDVIFMIGMAGAVMIGTGAIGLHIENKNRFSELEGALKAQDRELVAHKRRIRILEQRAMQRSDKIYIVNSDEDLHFPNSEAI